MKNDKLEKIRKRRTYKFWKELFEYCNKNSTEDILLKVWEILDDRRGWGSKTNSNCALESLEQAIRDSKRNQFNPSRRCQ